MKESVLTRHNLYEAAIRHDGAYSSLIDLANFRHSHDGTDLSKSSVDGSLVRTAHLYLAHTAVFIDGNGSASLFLHSLDNLSTRADDSTDKLFRNGECLDTWNLRFHLSTWLSDGISNLSEDIFAAGLCLQQCFLKDVEAKSVALDIHLCSCQAVFCTGSLEVHIAQVVFITEDIAQYSVFIFTRVLNQTHSDTADRLLHRNTGIHQSQSTCANSCHG